MVMFTLFIVLTRLAESARSHTYFP
jgi:hypothetical protein